MATKNNLQEIHGLLMKQMQRLDKAIQGEVRIETARSGALSQNAGAYLKTLNVSLRIKEMSKNNEIYEERINKEIGVLEEE